MQLYRAAATDNAQQNGDNGNNQQHVNQAVALNARSEDAEEAKRPNQDEDYGDEIQEVTHE
jgi:hypothetical protein